MASTSNSTLPAIEVPPGFRLHTENTTRILLSRDEAFLNPVQEFNRDLSVACIRVWSEEFNLVKEEKMGKGQALHKGLKNEKDVHMKSPDEPSSLASLSNVEGHTLTAETAVPSKPKKFVLLEALSATGLRAIRYAKEIPFIKYVIANDLSPSAVEVIKRNVNINNLMEESKMAHSESSSSRPNVRIRVHQGDACSLMYSFREDKKRVDVVDIDPYGTAAPFVDAALQCVNDGGLLCVTCTDLSVLATTNFPEKCFSNYGGIPVKAEYCHEAALRLVLHTLSTSASRYGRYIEPLLCLSIDFYVRLFVRVRSAPIEVKKALSKNSTFYICTTCQSYYEQPLGKMLSKIHEQSGQTNIIFKTQAATLASDECPECDSHLHIAGPMWSAPLHDADFVGKVLAHIEESQAIYGTAARMKGMLAVVKEELPTLFYFTPSKVASFFHCKTPSLDDVASALLNAGHKVSRSHACPGSLKSTASHRELHDIYRSWIKRHPVKMDNISQTSPARRLLAKETLCHADFTRHPKTISRLENVKLVRYQENPANWGPGKKALKRKGGSEVLEEPPAKRSTTKDEHMTVNRKTTESLELAIITDLVT